MGGQSVPVGVSPACIWLLAPLRGAHPPQRLRSGSANPPGGPLGNAGGEAPRLPSLRGSHCGSGDRPSNHVWALKSILWTEMPGSEALAQSRGLGKPPQQVLAGLGPTAGRGGSLQGGALRIPAASPAGALGGFCIARGPARLGPRRRAPRPAPWARGPGSAACPAPFESTTPRRVREALSRTNQTRHNLFNCKQRKPPF